MTREDYYRQHKCCPKCGSKKLMFGLVGYIFDSRHPEKYKDTNPVECLDCGYKGNVHSLVPEEKNLKKIWPCQKCGLSLRCETLKI